jgi:hypothetical protein
LSAGGTLGPRRTGEAGDARNREDGQGRGDDVYGDASRVDVLDPNVDRVATVEVDDAKEGNGLNGRTEELTEVDFKVRTDNAVHEDSDEPVVRGHGRVARDVDLNLERPALVDDNVAVQR